MIKQLIHYCLIAIILLQSVATVADVHQSHQSGAEHVSFEHEHDEHGHSYTPGEAIDHTQSQELDCHHCCHCHGIVHLYLLNSHTIPKQPKVATFNDLLVPSDPTTRAETLLRPPIV